MYLTTTPIWPKCESLQMKASMRSNVKNAATNVKLCTPGHKFIASGDALISGCCWRRVPQSVVWAFRERCDDALYAPLICWSLRLLISLLLLLSLCHCVCACVCQCRLCQPTHPSVLIMDSDHWCLCRSMPQCHVAWYLWRCSGWPPTAATHRGAVPCYSMSLKHSRSPTTNQHA